MRYSQYPSVFLRYLDYSDTSFHTLWQMSLDKPYTLFQHCFKRLLTPDLLFPIYWRENSLSDSNSRRGIWDEAFFGNEPVFSIVSHCRCAPPSD